MQDNSGRRRPGTQPEQRADENDGARDMVAGPNQPCGPSYAIGYGRPPAGARFAPGRSGNPNGRPRKDQAFKALLERELAERVSVKEQGRRRKLSKRGVIVKRLVSEAMAGNPKHLALVLAHDPVAAAVLGEVTAALSRPPDDRVKADLIERLRAAVGPADAHPRTSGLADPEEAGCPAERDPTGLPRDPDA